MENVFAQAMQLYEIHFRTAEEWLPYIESAFDDIALSHSSLAEDRPATQFITRIALDFEPSDELAHRLDVLKKIHGDVFGEPQIIKVEDKDWVSLVQQDFAPMRYGRFFVHGSHVPALKSSDAINIVMDVGAAFGTGEHETTGGCLLALDAMAKHMKPSRILDMGTGTGSLAIDAAKRFNAPVLAVDIDEKSVQVATSNVKRNKVQEKVQVEQSIGYRSPLVSGEYDLVIANILAKPLMKMAKDARRHTARGGKLILSGLLTRQERQVLYAHRMQGFALRKRWRIGQWSALVLAG